MQHVTVSRAESPQGSRSRSWIGASCSLGATSAASIALSFRDLARQLAQNDYGGSCDLIEFEHWHLLPSAAELSAVTPAEKLPWSYAKRFANALDAVRGCSGVTTVTDELSARGVTWSRVEVRDLPPPMDRVTMKPTWLSRGQRHGALRPRGG